MKWVTKQVFDVQYIFSIYVYVPIDRLRSIFDSLFIDGIEKNY